MKDYENFVYHSAAVFTIEENLSCDEILFYVVVVQISLREGFSFSVQIQYNKI